MATERSRTDWVILRVKSLDWENVTMGSGEGMRWVARTTPVGGAGLLKCG